MSIKIADSLKTKSNSSTKDDKNNKKIEIKNEIDEISSNDSSNFKIRECRVALNDFNHKVKDSKPEIFKIQEECFKNIKNESEGDFDIILDPKVHPNSSKRIIKQTSKNKSKKEVKCKFCDQICQYTYLSRHMIAFHSDQLKSELHECKICGLKLFMKKRFDQHMELKHSDGQNKYFVCDLDGKKFITKGTLHNHIKTHLSTVECKICGKFIKPLIMALHLRVTHSTEENFHCQICSKSFKSMKYLNSHKKSHDKKFECKMCSKTFQWATALRKHTRDYHDNPKSFACEICENKFNCKSTLKLHMRRHDKNRPKPFECQRCDFKTDNSSHFIRHQKSHVHQDERIAAMKNPLKCQICAALCRDKQILSQHIKSVHPKELLQCDLCGKTSKIKRNLKKHFEIHLRRN
jgi:KRAB domain-containing zinc finger protein